MKCCCSILTLVHCSLETGISSLWIDGKRVVQQAVGIFQIDTDAEIRIGARQNDARYFKGKISCVQIYSKALSEAEVAAVKDRCFKGQHRIPQWAQYFM